MAYPFGGDGIILLASGAVFFYLIHLVAGRALIIGLLLLLAGSGYLISYLQKILLASAAGEARMPDWPDFSDLGELVSPIFQFLSTIVISFGPAILVRAFAPEDSYWKPWAFWTAVGAGCLYFPMAWIAVTMADSLSALNPLAIAPSILRILGSYLPAVGILSAIVLLDYFGNSALPRLLPIPILPNLLSEFIGLYLATVEMRILGLLYWHNREKLAWFER